MDQEVDVFPHASSTPPSQNGHFLMAAVAVLETMKPSEGSLIIHGSLRRAPVMIRHGRFFYGDDMLFPSMTFRPTLNGSPGLEPQK